MNEINEQIEENDGFRFHFIETKKFKTIQFIVKCKTPLHKDTITKRALLPYVLEKGTKNYPTEKQLMRQLDELYGATLSVDTNKKGNYHILNFRLEIANEKFIQHETNMIADALRLLHEVMFQPYVENEGFSKEIVRREKISLKNDIEAIYDDKLAFANKRLIEEMCVGERFSIATNGYTEDLPFIHEHNLYTYYMSMLEEDEIDFYMIGDFQKALVAEKVQALFTRTQLKRQKIEDSERQTDKEVKDIQEVQDIQQAKLHIGFRTNCTLRDDSYEALLLFNGIFGSYPNSKLFQEVREKHSLAYYATSRIESHKGLLIVMAGVENTDNEKAKTIIFEQLKAMQAGDFTEEVVEETKRLFMNDLRETLDHPQGIVELFYQQMFMDTYRTIDAFMEQIEKVTKKEIVDVANNIVLDTVYLLTNEGEGQMDE